MKVNMTEKDFWDKYEDEFLEFAYEDIVENQENYFEGYTCYSEEDYPEAYESNKEEILELFLDQLQINLIYERR